MPAAQHCRLAVQLAREGHCLVAGQHLAYCSGAGELAAAEEARRSCNVPLAAGPMAPTPAPNVTAAPPAPALPPRVIGSSPPAPTAQPTAQPTTQPTNEPAAPTSAPPDSACDEVMASAMHGACERAELALPRCVGERRRSAEQVVASWCPRERRDEIFGGR